MLGSNLDKGLMRMWNQHAGGENAHALGKPEVMLAHPDDSAHRVSRRHKIQRMRSITVLFDDSTSRSGTRSERSGQSRILKC